MAVSDARPSGHGGSLCRYVSAWARPLRHRRPGAAGGGAIAATRSFLIRDAFCPIGMAAISRGGCRLVALYPEVEVAIHPADATRFAVIDGEPVRIASRRGEPSAGHD